MDLIIMQDPTMTALSIFEDPFYQGFEPCFGMGLHPLDFTSNRVKARPHNMPQHLATGYSRPWALVREAAHELGKKLHFGKDGFQTSVDVHHFMPKEITVKTVDQTVVIEAKHEERDDGHGSVTRHFMRKYVLPKEYDPHLIYSSLSSDGVLTVKAPIPKQIMQGKERNIPIHQTGPAHLSLKENQPHEEAKENGYMYHKQ